MTHSHIRGKEIPDGWTTSYQYTGVVVVPAGEDERGEIYSAGLGRSCFFNNITRPNLVGPFDKAGVEDIVLV